MILTHDILTELYTKSFVFKLACQLIENDSKGARIRILSEDVTIRKDIFECLERKLSAMGEFDIGSSMNFDGYRIPLATDTPIGAPYDYKELLLS